MRQPTPFDRRAFLRRGLQLGAVASGAVILESCNTSAPTTTTTTLRPPTLSDWGRLRDTLTGILVLPSSATYGADRLLYNSKFVDLHPQAIAYCANAVDVSRCVDFVSSHVLPVAARSGGHSYAGYSSCDGLVVDISHLSSIAVDTYANTARVGAGTTLIDLYNAVGSRDRLLPGGSCPTVGIAGLTLGGGVGVFGRKYGLTCDNLLAVDIVTVDGQLVTASAEHHADLFWACQGGGGGNFGVATSFDFSVHAMPEVTLFTLQYPWSAAATMLEAWQHWVLSAPDELWSNCQLLSQGSYGFLAQMSGVFCGSSSELSSLLATLQTAIGSKASYSFVGSRDYVDAMKIEAGCSGLSVAACHLPSQNPDGHLSHSAYSAKSSYVDGPMTTHQATLMVDAIENLYAHAPTLGGALAFDAYGGAINRVASATTAFVHRDTLACIQATFSWSSTTPASEIMAGQTWLTWLGTNVFDPRTSAYQNYIDPTLTNWKSAYYGGNLERLVDVKKRYDPENRFSFAQSIPVAL